MNITKTAIENNRVTWMVLVVIVIMGIATYGVLSRDAMPPFTIRICNVVTTFPGASPERVEELITDKIEKVVQELPELESVTSESRTGLSIVTVEVTPDIKKENLQEIWDRLRLKIDGIRSELPAEIQDPDIQDDGIGVVYGIVLGLQGDGYSFYELKQYADDIRDDLIKLDDASEVEISGIQDEQIYVEFENSSLAKLGLTAGQLQSIIASTNIVFPGGAVSLEDERIVLEPTGNYEEIEDLKNTIIPIGNDGETVKLGEVTSIHRTYKNPVDHIVKIDGNQGLGISIALKEGANLIKLGEEINKKLENYQERLPIGISIKRIADQDYYVDAKVSGFLSNVIQSVIIVLLVMLLFLGLRTGFVVASLIPMALLMTLLLMGTFDIGLNQVSLAALIMALGMLVDNAIVVSESMMVKMEAGTNAKTAAIESSKELMIPLLVSSLTTSAAFLAFFLAENTMGEMMGPLFSVITLALLSSWVMSMTLVTMLGVVFIKVKLKKEGNESQKTSIFDRLLVYYKDILDWVLKRPIAFTIGLVLMLFFSFFLFTKIPFIFFPDSDRNLITADINLPLGTKIEKTAEVVEQLESFITDSLLVYEGRKEGILDWSAFIGEGPKSYDLGYQPGEANSGYAHLLINTSSFEVNQKMIDILDDYCFNTFPDAEVDVKPLAGGGSSGADVEVRVSGNSPEELFTIGEWIKQKMNAISFTKNIKDDWGPKIKKFVIDIDQDKANRAELTNQDIAVSLKTVLTGFDAGDFRDSEDNIPIIMRSEGSQELEVRQLEGANIFAQNSGKSVPLIQVANIIPEWQYAKILRRNLYRTMTISCDVRTGYTASDITALLTPAIEEDSKNWKSGYTYELGGESENSSEAMGAVAAKLPLAGFIILLLLVTQFNSFRKTFIVLSTIPLGFIGVVLGLFLFRSYFGFMAFLGVISLAGIVINNAIVLIDRIKLEQEEFNKPLLQAIKDASFQRFRPILLTTFTTTLGLIPLYLGGGLMWEPMAIAIMIGLLFATVITLLFIPVLYKMLFGFKIKE